MGSPPTSSVVEVPAPDLADAQKENDQCFVGLDIEDLAGLEFTHVQDTPISHSLSNFAKNNGLKFETQVYEVKKESSKPSDWGTRVLFNGTEISAAVSSSKKAAKSACWTSAFSVLRKRCDYVERKGRRDNFEVVVPEFKSHDQQETENKTNSRSHEESDLDSSFEIQDFLQESSPAKPSPVKTRLKLEDQVIFYRSGLLDEKSKLQTLPKEIEKPVYLQFNNTQPATSHNFGPMKEHIDSIQRIKRRLKDFRQGAPYCADQAARREGIDICQDIYTCGANILAIRDYIKSTRSRLYQKSEDLFITKKSHYCVLNIRGVEVAYGFGPNCKRKAFDQLEYFLREHSTIHVVSALRHKGVRTEPQLTLALTPGDRQVGYILPANDAGRIPTGRDFVQKPKNESNVVINLSDLTLFMMEGMDCPLTILSRTASLNKMQIFWEESEKKNKTDGGGTWEATVSFDKTKIADGHGKTKKDAKADAASNALRIMLEKCRVLEERKKEYAHENALGIEEVRNGLIDKSQPHLARMAKAREKQAKKINKGAMLMRLMGWTGGGLGIEGNGIDQPVDHNAPRYGHETHGLGIDDNGRCSVTVEQADILISRYAASQISEDLSFSTDLGKEERKAIHVAVSRYGLRSKSYGKGAGRYLVVSRSAQQKLMMLQEGCTLSQASLKQ
ncbi:unnamed protein product [Oikopleura dioica]|uniref:NF-kappa-B-repressing factor n=2 Tax=Oikopleura dioica TaxID=34765 RepID=E4XBE9_OIKDI|nr:unnamed protein product [Oikopleura dioica]